MSEGVEVREAGRALKVHTDTPHLVSLGGGRLSTAVTLHPLPEGRVVLGSGPAADISVQGTGVDPVHCQIENISGVVMLFPIAEMTAIDGLIISTPTRLTQGCMICIGRSNYLRFNHPAEARLMKSILPNTRISMVPLNFYPGGEIMDGYLSGKPPMAPRRSPRDSWGDVSNSSSCNSGSEESCGIGKSSKLEYPTRASLGSARHLSPKVFPPGSSTVSSPASVVLGTNHPGRTYQNSPSPGNVNGVQLRSRSATPTNLLFNSVHSSTPQILNGEISRSQSSTPTVGLQSRSPGTPLSSSRSVTCSPAFDRSCRSGDSVSSLLGNVSYENVVLGSTANRSGGSDYRSMSTPSPAFNRNPQPYRTTGYRSITPSPGERNTSMLFTNGPRSVTPSPPRVSAVSSSPGVLSPGHRRSVSAGNHGVEPARRVTSPTPSYGSNCSMEELNARKEELEQKRKQAQKERMKEQEAELQERARLEEILNMCAEYERQAQNERQSKPPTTPTIHQNRIKTNGSLPRDKRLPSPGSTSGCMSASEDELAEIFTFELNSAAGLSPSVNSPVPAVITDPPRVGPQISVLNSGGSPAGVVRSPYENVVIGSPGCITYPQSPRTRIKTIPTPSREVCEVFENRLALSSDYDFVNSLPRNKQQTKTTQSMDPSVISNNRSASDAKSAVSNQKMDNEKKFILPLANGSPTKPPEQAVTPKMNGEVKDRTSADSELSVQESMVDGSSSAENSKNTLEPKRPPRRKSRDEGESLRKERGKLLATLSGIKRKITEIEQQEEELLRGLEVERALLDGEWQAQRDKLAADEERMCSLEARVEQLDQDMELSRQREIQRQTDCRLKLEAADGELCRLEQEVIAAAGSPERQKEVADKLQHQHDILEAERKLFEDLEFRHLEEEASCLARREELQRELTDVCVRVEDRRARLRELEQQRLETAQGAQQESRSLERHLINQLHRLEEARNKLRIVEAQLEELARQGAISSQESSPDASSDIDEPITPARITASSKQSQDDLDRISRVTMGAPLEMSTGSLGRKTLASLQEIERNRQLHLVQQGSQVIEEERKRVQELKRRVQDEVRAQWEERRQREANCTSLNSVGSDEANSLTSSDIPTESASSDDALEKRSSVPATNSSSGGGTVEKNDPEPASEQNQDEVREKERELERDYDETRPLSDGSSYEHQLAVRMREKAARLQQQRPLTRYLPIRSENLNLRHHIESAGHQIELCPHVTIDSTSCRGYLQKMGSKFHHWNKRWFVFDRVKRTLMYYADRSEKKPRGGAYFQSIEEVYVDHLNSVKSPHPHLTFVVKTIERTFHLMAPSAEAMRIWVDVIFTGAEGYQEFEPGT